MGTIKQTYRIKAPVSDVWQALVDPKLIDAWGGGPAVMDDRPGTEFSLWSGSIHGRNTDVVAEKKLVQDWYSENWPDPSIATFELFADGGGTRLEFKQKNVPDEDVKDIDDGWRDFYLGAIKTYLENR